MKPTIYKTRHSHWCDLMRKNHIPTKPTSVWSIIAQMVGVMAIAAAAIYFGLDYFGLVS